MANDVKINIKAGLNASDADAELRQLNKQFNKLGESIAKANQLKFNPISSSTWHDFDRIEAAFEKIKRKVPKLADELNRTGQADAMLVDINWDRLTGYSARAREALRHKVFSQATGHIGSRFAASDGAFNQGPAWAAWKQAGRKVAGAGMGAAGPAGAIAGGAISGGMGGGFMAGLAGLVGGIAAFGVAKLIGGAASKIGDAQQEFIGYDTLKRSLGDVNVGFNTLKESLRASSDSLEVTFQEGQKLAQTFARISGGGSANTLASETLIAGGFGRSFGIDPSESVGFFAQLRQMGVTRNPNESRQLGLMIGEGIARSGAFSKASEILQAIGNFAVQQTRLGLSPANVGGYASFLSAMVGSGVPGFDPQGSAAILNRINSAVAGGGGAGEAGQYFTHAALARDLGLDPLQALVLREKGMFGTGAQAFGKGSAFSSFMDAFGGAQASDAAASSTTTNIDAIMRRFQSVYGRDPRLMALALQRYTGLGVNQAMGFATLWKQHPTALTGVSDRLRRLNPDFDFSRLTTTGIAALGQIQTGGRDVLEAQAKSLLGRTGDSALSATERDRLTTALAGDNPEALRDVLTELTATREQEQTEGEKTRQTLVGMQNELQRLASGALPLLNDMRAGILLMAGGGKKGAMGVQLAYAEAESAERRESISAAYGRRMRQPALQEKLRAAQDHLRKNRARMTPAEQEAEIRKIADIKRQLGDAYWQDRDTALERNAALDAEDVRLEDAKQEIRDKFSGAGNISNATDALFESLLKTESNGQHTDANGNLITNPKSGARGISQLMPETARKPGFGIVGIQNESEAEYRRVGREYLNAMLHRYGGDRRKALAAYNWGPGNVDKAIQEHGDEWLSYAPDETQKYIPSILGRVQDVNVNVSGVLHDRNGAPAATLNPSTVKTRVPVPPPYGAR